MAKRLLLILFFMSCCVRLNAQVSNANVLTPASVPPTCKASDVILVNGVLYTCQNGVPVKVNIPSGACQNQVVTAVSSTAPLTCTTLTTPYLPASGVTAGTYTNPSSIVVDSTGRIISIVSGSGGSAPSAPTNVVATAGNASATITFTAPSGTVTQYNIGTSTTQGGTYSFTSCSASPCTISSLTNNTPTYFVVNAQNVPGTGPNSYEVEATPTIVINVQSSPYSATGNGSTNDAAAINSAIAALASGDTLYFPCPSSSYLVTSALNPIIVNNVIIAGQTGCAGGTVMIKGNNSNVNGGVFQVGRNFLNAAGSGNYFASSAAEGTNQFTTVGTMASLGISGGSYVYLEVSSTSGDTSHSACSGSGCIGETVKVASVSGSTATIETHLHHAYTTTYGAWVQIPTYTPVSGLYVHDLVFDGDDTAAVTGLWVGGVVNSSFNNITAQNVHGYSGNGGGIFGAFALSYNTVWTNITTTGIGVANSNPNLSPCGTPGNGCFASSFELGASGNLNMDTVSLVGAATGSWVFGALTFKTANAYINNMTIDFGNITYAGRLIKMQSDAYFTYNNLIVRNAAAAYENGVTIEYYSTHDIYNNCSFTNFPSQDPPAGNAAIYMYGGVNGTHASEGSSHYNTFNNCTIGIAGPGPAIIIGGDNDYTAFIGGSLVGSANNAGYPVLGLGDSSSSNLPSGVYVSGETISGPGTYGIADNYIGANNVCINNSIFASGSGFTSGGIDLTGGTVHVGSGNTLNGYSSNLTAGTCTLAGMYSGTLFSLSPSTLSFTTAGTQTVTLTNIGTVSLTAPVIETSLTTDYSETDTCSGTITAGGTCTISVAFSPTQVGSRPAQLSVTAAGGGPMQSVSLAGD